MGVKSVFVGRAHASATPHMSSPAADVLIAYVKQEGRAVAGNYRAMRDTRTESLHLILGQRSEWKQV